MGGVGCGSGPDLREHFIGFAQKLVIPKTKNSETLADKPSVTTRVRMFSDVVYPAINLDDNPV